MFKICELLMKIEQTFAEKSTSEVRSIKKTFAVHVRRTANVSAAVVPFAVPNDLKFQDVRYA